MCHGEERIGAWEATLSTLCKSDHILAERCLRYDPIPSRCSVLAARPCSPHCGCRCLGKGIALNEIADAATHALGLVFAADSKLVAIVLLSLRISVGAVAIGCAIGLPL